MRLLRARWGVALAAIAALGALGAIGAAAFIYSGAYDISATRQHTQAVYSLLEVTMHRSVRLRAASIDVPPLQDEALITRGAGCFVQKCVQCHGGPGYAQSEIGRSMQPLPGPLVDASAKWSPAELYWITRHGIKMSGMPAWEHRMRDEDLWAVVAFMNRLSKMTTLDFRAAASAPVHCSTSNSTNDQASSAAIGSVSDSTSGLATSAATSTGSGTAASASLPSSALANDAPLSAAERGRRATTQYACRACHMIPGVTGTDVAVGPGLAGFANRRTIAGAVANEPEQLVRWIRDPQSIDPLTTMPNMLVSDADARDIAAYLLTLR